MIILIYICIYIYKYIILYKTCKLLHYLYQNTYMFIVTSFIAGCFKEMLVSSP